jgi:c-di-GMP-related signal transduction protein
VRSQQIPAVMTTCLELLREVQQADLDFQRMGRLIRKDVSLTYKLLRYANSAMFQRSARIQSINRALLTLGEENIRRWVVLATLPMLATNKPSELVKLSLVRARFCERLAELAHRAIPRAGGANDAFLMGIFSLLDALIDQPLDEALHSVDLGKEVTEALLGIAPDRDFLTGLYRLIRSYEVGDWDDVERLSKRCGIPPAAVGDAYIDATVLAEEIVRSTNQAASS